MAQKDLLGAVFANFWHWLEGAATDAMTLAGVVRGNATPESTYLIGAAIAVVATFLVLCGVFARDRSARGEGRLLQGNLVRELRTAKAHLGGRNSQHSSKPLLETRGTRVETLIEQVAPHQAQALINLRARFHWRLKSTQRVRTKDTHREVHGDTEYDVTETEDFIQLVFERDLDEPNINKVRALEAEYLSIEFPTRPGYVLPVIVCLFLGLGLAAPTFGLSVIGSIVLFVAWSGRNTRLRAEADKEIARLVARQAAILEEVDRL